MALLMCADIHRHISKEDGYIICLLQWSKLNFIVRVALRRSHLYKFIIIEMLYRKRDWSPNVLIRWDSTLLNEGLYLARVYCCS